MNSRARHIGSRLYKCGEFVLTAMLAVMFFAFLFQIASRYIFDWPTGWTNELSAILWIWLVLFGAAFVVTEQEEMRFDLIYSAVGPKVRRVMFLISAAALLVLYGASFPAVVSYVTFMKVESSAYIGIRFDFLYSIYIVFVVAIIVRYLWLGWQVIRGEAPEEFDPTEASSGL
jgi:TRAP-type C4-dicarboxylate transport system permease small subunit